MRDKGSWNMAERADVIVVKRQELLPQALGEVLDLCSLAYEIDYEPIFNTFPESTHVLAYQDGKLVSHALWVTRWLQPGEAPLLKTAYIEAVATEPAYQRRGLATAVMRILQVHIVDYDLGALSPAEYGLYAKLGWELWRGKLFIRNGQGMLATPGEEVMILRLPRTPPLDLNEPLSTEWREGELW